jgi:hypothetical protein
MICAWCSTWIAGDGRHPGLQHNYGMCRRCVEEQLARLAPKLRPRSVRPRRARPARAEPAGFSTATSL